MPKTACPFCFRMIDSSHLAYQCAGRGNTQCKKEVDPERERLTGSRVETYPTFRPSAEQNSSTNCPICRGPAPRRACPECHTALPSDFTDSKSPMIGLVGAEGSGKTILMTVLVKHLRDAVGKRFGADIGMATDNPDGLRGFSDYQASREDPLYTERVLPTKTEGRVVKENRATPVVLRWRQETTNRLGLRSMRATVLSFVDTAGEDLNAQETAFMLHYISVCDSLIITLDPFALPGARARLNLPDEAIQVGEDVPLSVVKNITELLRVEGNVRKKRRITMPVAIVFTKIDAFFPTLDRHNPIMSAPPEQPAYHNADGQAVHEHMLALLHEWKADDIDNHMRLNYADYRYFAVSALGAEPDYEHNSVAPGGVRPHRVEDPILWLLSKAGTVRSA